MSRNLREHDCYKDYGKKNNLSFISQQALSAYRVAAIILGSEDARRLSLKHNKLFLKCNFC